MSIVSDGYQWVQGDQSNVAFFRCIRWPSRAPAGLSEGAYLLAGILLSSAFMFRGLASSTAWCSLIMAPMSPDGRSGCWRSSPQRFSFRPFNGVAVPDDQRSRFLLRARRRWALAGMWGLMRRLTRVTGLLLNIAAGLGSICRSAASP